MSLEKLLKDRIIRKIRIDKKLVRRTFEIAKRDLKTAKEVYNNESYSWSLAIAYNAMLQAGRALMFAQGFKPAGEYKHVAVVKFLHETFGREITDRMITIFDRVRKKRHKVIYEEPEIISEYEAKNAILWAGEFIGRVEKILKERHFL